MPVGGGNVRVRFTADSTDLQRGTAKASREIDDFGKRTHRSLNLLKTAAKGAGLALAAGLAVGAKKSAEAAIEAEKANARLRAQLDALGISYGKHAKQIDEVIQKHSRLSGLDDEDLQDAFTNIVRVTGDVDKGLRLTGLAADFARAKHMDVAKAGELVGKVAGGNTGILSRYGIQIEKGASASEALAVLQQKFAGQAEAYGKTTQGALDRASVASENLGEVVGAKLTPLLAKGANALVDMIDASGQLAGPIRTVSGVVKRAFDTIQAAFSGGDQGATKFGSNVREMVTRVVALAKRLWTFLKTTFKGIEDDLRDIARAWLWFQGRVTDVILFISRRTIPIIESAIKGLIEVVRGVVKIIAGILSGDFSKAWDGVKLIVRGALRALKGVILGVAGILKDAMVSLAKRLIDGLVDGLKALPGAIKNAIVSGVKKGVAAAGDIVGDIISAVNPFGDGIGRLAKGIGDGVGAAAGRGGGASLMGADPDLYPFARMAASAGLHTTSGLRVGAITSSGNQSYHATGDAIDVSGPAGAMLKFFRTVKRLFGANLRELIYTPGGSGIKDGRPFTYSGQVAQDHYDHVHVAYTGPFGDGEGQPGVVRAFRRAIRDRKANRLEQLALWEAGIVESGLRNLRYGDADSLGALQERESIYGRAHALDPYKSAVRFLREAQALRPWHRSAGALAQAVQRSRYPGRYDAAKGRALKFLPPAAAKGKGKGGELGVKLGPMIEEPPPPLHIEGDNLLLDGGGGGGSAPAVDTGAAELAVQLKRMNDFNDHLVTHQGPLLIAAMVAAVNGGIGQRLAPGLQGLRSPVGSVAGF